MKISVTYLLAVTIAITLVNIFLRGFPFLVFSRGGKVPPAVAYLGRVISAGAIAMLIVYCLGITAEGSCSGAVRSTAELLISSAVVVGLQWKWKNPLLSILLGTVLYMVLIRL